MLHILDGFQDIDLAGSLEADAVATERVQSDAVLKAERAAFLVAIADEVEIGVRIPAPV